MNLEIGLSFPVACPYCGLDKHYRRPCDGRQGAPNPFAAATEKQTMVWSKAKEGYLLLAGRDLISP